MQYIKYAQNWRLGWIKQIMNPLNPHFKKLNVQISDNTSTFTTLLKLKRGLLLKEGSHCLKEYTNWVLHSCSLLADMSENCKKRKEKKKALGKEIGPYEEHDRKEEREKGKDMQPQVGIEPWLLLRTQPLCRGTCSIRAYTTRAYTTT